MAHSRQTASSTASASVSPSASGADQPAGQADAHAGEHVAAVTRSLAILDAFDVTDAQLALAELARRTALPKPSVLRLARTLAASGYLVPLEGGAWRLGPAAARLGARYQRAFDLRNLIEPALQRLAQQVSHSTSFFALENKQRVRLLRVLGADGFVSPTRVGEPLPLDKGAAGQVILAFSDGAPANYAAIRERGFHITVGEADAGSASIAAPVFAAGGKVMGAVSIAAPAAAGAADDLARCAGALVDAARQLSQDFARADLRARQGVLPHGSWHPQ